MSHNYGRKREVIDGALLAGGRLEAGEGRVPRLHIASTSRPLLEWISDELEWLSRPIRTIESAEAAQRSLSETFDHDVPNANAVYEFRTVSHPLFGRLKAQLAECPATLIDSIDRTPTTLGLVYARHGRYAEERGWIGRSAGCRYT